MTELTRDDLADIAAVLVRYASGIDRRDWELFRTCFTDDCVADYGGIGRWRGVDEITTWMDRTHAPVGPTMHAITNIDVRPRPDGLDGAVARSYVDALIVFPDGASAVRSKGFYDDELVRTADGWRIAARRFTDVVTRVEALDGPDPAA